MLIKFSEFLLTTILLYPVVTSLGFGVYFLDFCTVFECCQGQTVTIHIKNKSFFLEGSTDDWRKIFDVNVMALCICTREAIKVMRQKKIAGHIIHINSVVGHQVPVLPKPNFNVYPASKHAVTALTETLRQELCYNHSPIKVSVSIKWSKQSRAKVCFARNNACRRLQSLFFF